MRQPDVERWARQLEPSAQERSALVRRPINKRRCPASNEALAI